MVPRLIAAQTAESANPAKKYQAKGPRTHPFGAEEFKASRKTTLRWLCAAGFLIDTRGTTRMIDPLMEGYKMPIMIDMPLMPKDVPHLDGVLVTDAASGSILTGENSTGSVAAFEVIVPASQRLPAPTHSHDNYEETYYGVDGVLTMNVDGQQVEVGPEQVLYIPRGAVHRFDNFGSKDAKGLCVITPAAIGPQYFREVAEVLEAAGGGPPDRAKMIEIMLRHGLTPAPPPPQT